MIKRTELTRKRRGLWAAAALLPATALAQQGALPTQAFRDEHKEVKVHLGHVTEWAGALRTQKPAEQKKTAEKITGFFQKHIVPHAQWEEQHLYPVVDELTGTRKDRFTSTMRHEHKIVGRWIDELVAEQKKARPDYVAFARRTDNLLGLLHAHFEEEEVVLLPYIDKNLTREQFEQRLKGAAPAHH